MKKIVLLAFVLWVLIVWALSGQQVAHYDHHGKVLLPDPIATPGDVRTTDEKDPAVCGNGLTSDVRDVPESLKKEIFAEYGVNKSKVLPGDPPPSEQDAWYHDKKTGKRKKRRPLYEIDHDVSLELGGSNNKKNLMPQPYYQHPGAHEKDRLENFLNAQVCDHKMTLPDAQNCIRKDWYACYLKFGLDKKTGIMTLPIQSGTIVASETAPTVSVLPWVKAKFVSGHWECPDKYHFYGGPLASNDAAPYCKPDEGSQLCNCGHACRHGECGVIGCDRVGKR